MVRSAADASSSPPVVTICIASLNTAAATELCLRSIDRHTRSVPYVVYVADCGSTDRSLPMLIHAARAGLLDKLEVEPLGRTHGEWLDHWTATIPTPYAAFVDSDIEILRDNWLSTLVDVATASAAAIVCSEMLAEVPNYVDHTGVPRRLASRPSPWMALVDISMCRGLASWQFTMVDDASIPEGQWGMDTGAALLRDLESKGRAVVSAPESFRGSFTHFGGLSWGRGIKLSSNWRLNGYFVKVICRRILVRWRLARLRLPHLLARTREVRPQA